MFRTYPLALAVCFSFVVFASTGNSVMAQDSNAASLETLSTSFSLALNQQDEEPEEEPAQTLDSGGWEISGPISLRSADPEPVGELVIKNIFDWSTSSDGSDDDFEYELEIEYGLIENHELIFELPVEFGDGNVPGNADITLGWHWRLWQEQGWVPAFAMRNYLRLPTGIDSDGVDYKWKGLLTKSIIPGKFRAHLNPYFAYVDGYDEEDVRHFQWGLALGADYRISDQLLLIADYRFERGEEDGLRYQHACELGIDWEIAEHQKIGFATEIGLDGDSHGPNVGAKLSYIISFE